MNLSPDGTQATHVVIDFDPAAWPVLKRGKHRWDLGTLIHLIHDLENSALEC